MHGSAHSASVDPTCVAGTPPNVELLETVRNLSRCLFRQLRLFRTDRSGLYRWVRPARVVRSQYTDTCGTAGGSP